MNRLDSSSEHEPQDTVSTLSAGATNLRTQDRESTNVDTSLTIYNPDSVLRRPAQLFTGMCSDFVKGAPLSWSLFQRKIKSLYRQTIFGIMWAFLPPLSQAGIWIVLNANQVIKIKTPVDYAAYVLTGMVLWQAFIDSLLAPIQAVNDGRTMLTKVDFPRETLITVGFYQVMFDLMIRSLLLIGVFLLRPVDLTWGAAFAPVALLTLVLLGFGLGLLIMPWGILYHDVSKFLQLAVPFWMLLTPIVYAPPTEGFLRQAIWFNPVAPVLVGSREVILQGSCSIMMPMIIMSLLTLPILLLGLLLYRISMPILIERMNA